MAGGEPEGDSLLLWSYHICFKIVETDKLSITTNKHKPCYLSLHWSDMLAYKHFVTVGMALYKIIKVPGSLD